MAEHICYYCAQRTETAPVGIGRAAIDVCSTCMERYIDPGYRTKVDEDWPKEERGCDE